jgi:hypothetical protein
MASYGSGTGVYGDSGAAGLRVALPIQRAVLVDDIDERKKLRMAITQYAESTGIGSLTRGEKPHHLLVHQLEGVDDKYPLLGSSADAAAVEERRVLRLGHEIKVRTAFEKESSVEVAMRTHMASILSGVLGPNAGAMLTKLQQAHPLHKRTKDADGNEVLVPLDADLFDGVGMWRDYLVILNEPPDANNHDKHVLVISTMRANPLPDHCSAAQFVGRIAVMQQKHNRHLGESELKGLALSRFIITQMHVCHFFEMNRLLREMTETPEDFKDSDKVIAKCVMVIQIATVDGLALPVDGAFVITGRGTCEYKVESTSFAGAATSMRADKKAKFKEQSGGRDKPAGKGALKLCKDGSCTRQHSGECFSSCNFKGPFPSQWDARQVARAEEGRKAHAAKLRKTYTPIAPRALAPPTATAGIAAPPMVTDGTGWMYTEAEESFMSQGGMSQYGFVGCVEAAPSDPDAFHAELMRKEWQEDAAKAAARARARGSHTDFREIDPAPALVSREFEPEYAPFLRKIEPEFVSDVVEPEPAPPAPAAAGVRPATAPRPDFTPYIIPLLVCIIALLMTMLLIDAAGPLHVGRGIGMTISTMQPAAVLATMVGRAQARVSSCLTPSLYALADVPLQSALIFWVAVVFGIR